MPLFRSPSERLCWLTAGGLVVLTWSTLKWARAVADWLRVAGWLTPTMYAIFALAGGAVLVWVLRQRPGAAELGVLALVAVGYALAVRPLMARPEEALHFVQYGAVGGFFYAALAERGRALRRAAAQVGRRPLLGRFGVAALAAWLLTVAAGWTDEGIQYLLPERVYDLRDVGFNAAAGALAVAALASRHWVRARRGSPPFDEPPAPG